MVNIIIEVKCCICGKDFNVKINPFTNKIETDCFHYRMASKPFLGWTYELNLETYKLFQIHYKNWFYRVVGFCKPTRELYYYIRQWYYKNDKFDLWECTECANSPDDI